ncbi:uncharacterized protein MELLADRAFT_89661 [Melampsora larici-populina 98AG31]|uniref:Uncharacterized protein n=1 Tax=Melampsora larici-populina (strain 98AG31 / pathotype 3-4-7) TaxID=747676 RepID=F4RU55_MELLP|nr:uncharacterized protein MELLADRAFT_89661 [Melampsora larici-populina 98AG31]EGG04116.1 hypothetical protein MELLADRAFT_89661 [Melampsora larici-populina 98AG31]
MHTSDLRFDLDGPEVCQDLVISPPLCSDSSSKTLIQNESSIIPGKESGECGSRLEEGYLNSYSNATCGTISNESCGNFEPIDWPNLILLTVIMGGSWAFGRYLPEPWANGQSISWARIYVGLIGIIIGTTTGYVLLVRIGKKVYNAVVFSTLIHSDVALNELDRFAEPGPISALQLLRFRFLSDSMSRSKRPYDKRPWSIYILYFLLIVTFSQAGSFLYGRTVLISSITQPQLEKYHLLPVLGGLSAKDIKYAKDMTTSFTDGSKWTVSSLSSLITPSTSNLPFISNKTGTKTSITFTQASSEYFSLNPTTVGPASNLWKAFENQISYNLNSNSNHNLSQDFSLGENLLGQESFGETGLKSVLIEYPLWGSRVSCKTIDEGQIPSQLISRPSSTGSIPDYFMVVANQTIKELLDQVEGDPELVNSNVLFNPTANSSDLTPGQVVIGPWTDDGVALSFQSFMLDNGTTGQGATAIDFILIRLNTSYINSSQSGPLDYEFETTTSLSDSLVGIDGAICITKVSPYLVRAVDSNGLVALKEIISEGNNIDQRITNIHEEIEPELLTTFDNVEDEITSTGKETVFLNAFLNSRNQLKKDNSRDEPYVPNPTLVQMSTINKQSIIPTLAYGKLNSTRTEMVIRSTNSRYFQWYLVGQTRIFGHAYVYRSVAVVKVNILWFTILMITLYFLGLLGILGSPKLPLNLPSQEIRVSTWLSNFSDQVILNNSSSEKIDSIDQSVGNHHHHITIRYRDPKNN